MNYVFYRHIQLKHFTVIIYCYIFLRGKYIPMYIQKLMKHVNLETLNNLKTNKNIQKPSKLSYTLKNLKTLKMVCQ